MHLKDYYELLELAPSATPADIKKAYRRLALLHHPDKNGNDPYSVALFNDIKEAYEVLINPSKKEYYLQQRWYNNSIGRKKKGFVITPVTILKETLELNKYVSSLDIHRMDQQGLLEYMLALVSDDTVHQLSLFQEPAIIQEIIHTLVRSSDVLSASAFKQLAVQLKKLSSEPSILVTIDHQQQQLNRQQNWTRYMPWLLLLIVLGICLLVVLINR